MDEAVYCNEKPYSGVKGLRVRLEYSEIAIGSIWI